jgi:WD40 repeat protein
MPNLSEAWKYETENFIWNINVSSAGELVAAGSWDTHIHLIDKKGASLWKYKTGDYVAGVGVSRDGEVVVGASYDKHLYGLNKAGKLLFKFKADAYVRGAAISATGEKIAAATWSGTVHMLDKKGEQVKDRPIYPCDLIGSIYELLGIDTEANLPHPQEKIVRVTATAAESGGSGGRLKEIM